MCYKCSSLKKINLSSLTNKVTSMMFMFGDCSLLKKIDLSSFNTNQVTNMSYMFNNCSSLKELNLSSFNTNQVTIMNGIFESINKSCKIKCKDEKIIKIFENETGCIII